MALLNAFRDVITFMTIGGQKMSPKVEVSPDRAAVLFRLKLIAEELHETALAAGFNMSIHCHDTHHTEVGFAFRYNYTFKKYVPFNPIEVADGLTDILYVTLGGMATFGMPAEELFNEVHASNMSKFVRNETTGALECVKNAEGKVQKPASYRKPDIKGVLGL